MRAIVIRRFRDKNTNALHELGSEINVNKGRFDELVKSPRGPYVEAVKQVK